MPGLRSPSSRGWRQDHRDLPPRDAGLLWLPARPGYPGAVAHSAPPASILVPVQLPRPMAEAEVVAFFRVIDALEDRTMFLLMLRCGLRVSEVSGLRWSAIDVVQGTLRVDNSKGQVDRVVYLAPDVATALRQWQRLQSAAAPYVFPSRMARKGGLPLGARHIRNRMTRSCSWRGSQRPIHPTRSGIRLPPSSSMPAPRWRW